MTSGVSPRIFETLRQLGLTEYGARCYVALLSLKSGEASAVAEAADVPRTKVYATLKDLVDAGWVVASATRPVVFKPVAPEERIALAEKRIAEDVSDATRELQARYAIGAQMIPMSAYMLRGRAAVDAKTIELISRARSEVFVNLGFLFEGEAGAIHDALSAARRRGVQVRLLIGPGIEGFEAFHPRVALFPFHGVVCDWRQAIIVMSQGDEEPVGMWNPTQAFVEAIAPMLRSAWESAPAR